MHKSQYPTLKKVCVHKCKLKFRTQLLIVTDSLHIQRVVEDDPDSYHLDNDSPITERIAKRYQPGMDLCGTNVEIETNLNS